MFSLSVRATRAWVGAAALLASSMVLAQQQPQQSQQPKPSGAAAVPVRVTAGEIAQNPARYYGQKVTLEGTW